MKALRGIVIVVVVLAIVAAGLLAYMGVFSKVTVSEEKTGPYTYAYEQFVGPYSKTGPVFAYMCSSLKKDGVKTTKSLGVYYDDPKTVPQDKLKSDCGCVIENADLAKLPKLLEKYTIRTLPAKNRIVATFPLRNMFSYMIGPMKVYPVLNKYAISKGYTITGVYELYDKAAGTITYMIETAK